MTIRRTMRVLCCVITAALSAQAAEGARCLVIVLDGLRPDYVTAELMPNLNALAERGVFCENHHAVIPTVTRVNASSLSTGCYPGSHGLLGNSIYIPEVNPDAGVSTWDAASLKRVNEATGGKLLTRPTLGQTLDAAGKKILVISSGSPGSSYLLNPHMNGAGIINAQLIEPPSLRSRVEQAIGLAPGESLPNLALNHWAVDAYLKIALGEERPDMTFLWLSDPDHTAHEKGIGEPTTLEALRAVDAEVGRILEAHRLRELDERIDLFVVSDHGFATHNGPKNPYQPLEEAGLLDKVIPVQGALYLKEPSPDLARDIVAQLQKAETIGAIFTQDALPGTLPLSSVNWDHPRSSAIFVSPNWTRDTNAYGWEGFTALSGVAGHGTSSPYDVHATLIAAGPSIRTGLRSAVPTANVDIAPTVCHILGATPLEPMDGRPLLELLKDGPQPSAIHITKQTTTVAIDGYSLTLHTSYAAGKRYVDYTETTR